MNEINQKEVPFELALQQMEEIVDKLEQTDIPLEESITHFQEGVLLSKICSDKLNEIHNTIQTLVEKDGLFSLKEADIEEND